MVFFTPRGLKTQARDRLRDNGSNARTLVFIYSGVLVLLNLLASGLHVFLEYQIDATGGLSGLGARSILQTIQTLLQYGTGLFSPFWNAGFLMVAMIWAADRMAQPKDLLYGFKRVFSVLSYQINSTMMMIFIMLATGYPCGFLFSLSPFGEQLNKVLEPVILSGTMDFSMVDAEALSAAYTPFLIFWMAVLIPCLILFYYATRFALYLMLDYPQMGAMRAMATSAIAMRGKKRDLLRLDLSFWWYYLLEALLLVVYYLDVILPILGIALPFDAVTAYFVFLALYGVLQLLLHVWKKPEISTAYALAYQYFLHPDHQDPPEEN